MPPDKQNQSFTPQSGVPAGGTRIIEPTGNVIGPETSVNQTPQVVVGGESPTAAPAPAPSPTEPSQSQNIYPNPQLTTQPVTRETIENDLKQKRRHKTLAIMGAVAVLIVLLCAGGALYWYSRQDHSVYRKLANAIYTKNGYTVRFNYPAVMTQYNANNPAILSAYIYVVNNQKASVGLGAPLPYGNALSNLGITPQQVISSLVTHAGSFANVIKKDNPNAFTGNGLYGSCHSYVKANSGQTDALCVSSQSGVTEARVIGEDSSNQYSLFIVASNSIWAEHQQVWQKVEKSFSY